MDTTWCLNSVSASISSIIHSKFAFLSSYLSMTGRKCVAASLDPWGNAKPPSKCSFHVHVHLGGGPVHPNSHDHGCSGCQGPRDLPGSTGLQRDKAPCRRLHNPPGWPHQACWLLLLAGPEWDEDCLSATQQQCHWPQELWGCFGLPIKSSVFAKYSFNFMWPMAWHVSPLYPKSLCWDHFNRLNLRPLMIPLPLVPQSWFISQSAQQKQMLLECPGIWVRQIYSNEYCRLTSFW